MLIKHKCIAENWEFVLESILLKLKVFLWIIIKKPILVDMQRIRPIVLLLSVFLLGTCQQQTSGVVIKLPEGKKVCFLNQTKGQEAIITDEVDAYFDKVQKDDIAVQTRGSINNEVAREAYILAYQWKLQEEVQAFTENEVTFLSDIIKDIYRMVLKLNPAILPDQLNFIKVAGKIYDYQVLYTRENNMVIPKFLLQKRDKELLKGLLAHELFHIYSRYRPEQRAALYSLFGFEKLDTSLDQIDMPLQLRKTIMFNPDAMDMMYTIQLEHVDGTTHQCLMLSSTEHHQYNQSGIRYFPVFSTNFYEIEAKSSGGYRLLTNADGSSTVDYRNVAPSFFKKIGYNTAYFYHPDEIVAENFSIMLYDVDLPNKSEEGQKADAERLEALKEILKSTP